MQKTNAGHDKVDLDMLAYSSGYYDGRRGYHGLTPESLRFLLVDEVLEYSEARPYLRRSTMEEVCTSIKTGKGPRHGTV